MVKNSIFLEFKPIIFQAKYFFFSNKKCCLLGLKLAFLNLLFLAIQRWFSANAENVSGDYLLHIKLSDKLLVVSSILFEKKKHSTYYTLPH